MRFQDPSWRERISAMARDIRDGWEPPPLVAGAFGDWDRVLMDGNHRHAALLAVGRRTHPVILVFDGTRQAEPPAPAGPERPLG